MIEAGQKERQRLERNLHDGAQQRLVALSLELSLLEERFGADPEAQARLDRAPAARSRVSLEELRDIARGLHPAVVTAHGLAVALSRSPPSLRSASDLTVDARRAAARAPRGRGVLPGLREPRQRRQARAGDVRDGRRRPRQDGRVLIEVVDDGIGGADTERGSGLRGLADRVEALDGRLRIWTPAGGGTRVRAEIPCAP